MTQRPALPDPICWNLTSQRHDFRGREALIVSIPKSGRTWLRVFLNKYYNDLYGGSYEVDETDTYPDSRPCYLFTHDRFSHLNNHRWYDYLRGKHLIPPRLRRRARIVLLARDLRDVMVSLYFQHTKRRRTYSGEMEDMIRHPRLGVAAVVRVMNRWAGEFPPERRLLAHYESWQANPAGLGDVVEFLDGGAPDGRALRSALEYSSFKQMKAREATNQSRIEALRPGDVTDEESYKVRRGVVGGYKTYLTEGQIDYIRNWMRYLDPIYGYTTRL